MINTTTNKTDFEIICCLFFSSCVYIIHKQILHKSEYALIRTPYTGGFAQSAAVCCFNQEVETNPSFPLKDASAASSYSVNFEAFSCNILCGGDFYFLLSHCAEITAGQQEKGEMNAPLVLGWVLETPVENQRGSSSELHRRN